MSGILYWNNLSPELSCKNTASEMSAQYLLSLVILSCFAADIFAQDCGRGKSEFVGYVVGGKPTVRGDWPWLVALINKRNENFFCGGSLIGAKHVLSGKAATRIIIIRDSEDAR